jgi:twitching motility protein PilT
MAALVHELNLARPVHIVTLEDPVEFLHKHQIGTVNQRELGVDFESYGDGLRAAVRQGPRVIVVGELRDREAVEMALCAAETGHLVFSNMRTVNASQTVHTLVGLFEALRQRLAECLRYCVSQTLVPKESGGRIAAFEVMAGTYRVQDLIRIGESEDRLFYHLIRDGRSSGMQTADAHLVQLFQDGLISEETCRNYVSRRPEVMQLLDRVQAGLTRAQADQSMPEELGDLKMDYTFERRKGES